MKRFLSVLLLWAAGCAVFGQTRPTLAILPFTGGSAGDGETIAELFSYVPELNEVFTPIPRTSIIRAVGNEQRFQMDAGMTDPDTIAAIGRQLGAWYVVAGNITRLESRNLLIISILKIDDLRQIAGDIQTYAKIEEIQDKLPGMARNITGAALTEPAGTGKLAVLPVEMGDNIDPRTADTLAQILSINLIRSGKYSVYPRTGTLEQVRREYDTQLSGVTADENLVDMGRGENPRLVLSVAARRLGTLNMFNASIIDLESGAQEAGQSVNYATLADGIEVMERLAAVLTGTAAPEEVPPAETATVKGGGGSVGKNLGRGVLNLALGLGSFTQKDWNGGLTLAGGYALAAGLLTWEMAGLKRGDAMAGVPGALGLGVAGVTAAYGFLRPFLFQRLSRNRAAAVVLDRLHIAAVPDGEGAAALSLSWNLRY